MHINLNDEIKKYTQGNTFFGIKITFDESNKSITLEGDNKENNTFDLKDINNFICDFRNCHISCLKPEIKDILFKNIPFENLQIENQTVDINLFFEKTNIKNLKIENSIFKGKFYINEFKLEPELEVQNNEFRLELKPKVQKIEEILIKNTKFEGNFKIQNCKIDKISINQCDFEKTADFHKSEFDYVENKEEENKKENKKEIKFTQLNFRGLALFGETVFNEKLIIKYATFEKLAHFKNAEFKKGIDLNYINFEKAVNFFGIKGLDNKEYFENTPQETYRLIKHHLKQLDNIIDANKYHSLELEACYLNLFKEDNINTVYDLIVLYLHKQTSNFSRNWAMVLLWIIAISALTDSYINGSHKEINTDFIILFAGLIVLFFIIIIHNFKKYSIVLIILLFALVIIIYCSYNYINIGNIFKYMSILLTADAFKKDCEISYTLFFLNKIILGYLYYQFIITIRKNTKPL